MNLLKKTNNTYDFLHHVIMCGCIPVFVLRKSKMCWVEGHIEVKIEFIKFQNTPSWNQV